MGGRKSGPAHGQPTCEPLMVVGLAGEDLVPAVDLLEQHDARQLVGEGDRAERQPVIDARQIAGRRTGPPITKQRSRPLARRCSRKSLKPIESNVLPSTSSSDTNARSGMRAATGRIVAHLDQLQPRITPEQLDVMRDVIDERWPQTAHGDDDDSHRWDTTSIWTNRTSPTATSTSISRRS